MCSSGLGVPVVVDPERAVGLLLGARGWSGSARLLGVGLSREARSALAMNRHCCLWRKIAMAKS